MQMRLEVILISTPDWNRKYIQYPLSLPNTAGKLRPTTKANDGAILLEGGVSQKVFPVSDIQTCTIIDRMSQVGNVGKLVAAQTFVDLADTLTNSTTSNFEE